MRGAFARALALVVALVVLAGVLRANATYFYCPVMERVADASCCGERRDQSTEASLVPSDCCKAHRIAAMPRGAVVTPPSVPSAPLLAYVAFDAMVSRSSKPQQPAGFANRSRAGPPPLLPGEARAVAMVFLI